MGPGESVERLGHLPGAAQSRFSPRGSRWGVGGGGVPRNIKSPVDHHFQGVLLGFFFLHFIHLSFNMNLCGKYAVLLTQTIWPEDLYDKKITQSEEGQSNRRLRRPLCFYYDIAFLYKTQ